MSSVVASNPTVSESELHDAAAKTEQQKAQARERKQLKRKRDADVSPASTIAIVCNPEKHFLFDTAPDTASRLIVQYLQNLQENDVVARPENWSEILNKLSTRKQYRQPILQHPWNKLSLNHYRVAPTHDEFQGQLNAGLPLPILILPNTKLGSQISLQTPSHGQPINKLLDEILDDRQAPIRVQDYSLPSLDTFAVEKTCEDVRVRFDTKPGQRGSPWNCHDLDDRLPGFKGPKAFENGANLRKWQLRDPNALSMNDFKLAPVPGTKMVDKWLLISEQSSGSTAHVDAGFAAWLSCLAGKKTFWLRNSSVSDKDVWEDFQIGDDHRMFLEPWARIDLTPGGFPPGTIYAVFTEQDSVFAGGHFLTGRIMDRFLSVLGQIEMDPSRTHDTKSVDLFQILENFIHQTLSSSFSDLTRRQLHQFVLALKSYVQLKLGVGSKDRTEQAHLKRRKAFVAKVQKESWIEKLKVKTSSIKW
ncbi:hypothetical protein MMC22_011933 [Lobaria immixta]|nr:hypothetical protein [Lobaria immixta]